MFIGVEVEQETSAPPPKKDPGSAPVLFRFLIFILLLVFYHSTKITLDVLLALLYKRPVSIDRRNFSFY